MVKVKAQTKILTDCLATTKVSNVVKQNDNLLNDHTRGCEKLLKINETLRKNVIESEIIVSPNLSASNQKKRSQYKNMQGSLAETEQRNDFADGQRLYSLVCELESLVDAQRTRLDILDEEAKHFRSSFHNL